MVASRVFMTSKAFLKYKYSLAVAGKSIAQVPCLDHSCSLQLYLAFQWRCVAYLCVNFLVCVTCSYLFFSFWYLWLLFCPCIFLSSETLVFKLFVHKHTPTYFTFSVNLNRNNNLQLPLHKLNSFNLISFTTCLNFIIQVTKPIVV